VKPDLRIEVGGITFKNPIMVASGTFGYGEEFANLIDLSKLGAIVTKSITLEERPGHPPPRTCETASGMLNAIGLANVGIERFIDEKIPYLKTLDTAIIVNVAGSTAQEYIEVCRKLERAGHFDMIELNISCPNVDAGGIEFGTNEEMTREIVREVRKVTSRPIIAKLAPNVTSIERIAEAAKEGGAAAVSAINSVVGMAVDVHSWKPRLTNGTGGLTGPAIKPVGVAMVHRIYRSVDIPIIGIGGIADWTDAVEYHLVGAMAIQVGTANFIDPGCTMRIRKGLIEYLKERGLSSVTDLIGKAQVSA
jgi:dihydroorotate dehydrogenase (NAD+) catalytic subunit